MKSLLKYLCIFFILLIFAASCSDDAPEVVDTTNPVLSNVQYSEIVEAGTEFTLRFSLQDNIGLGEVRIDVHDDFDGHDHENARLVKAPFAYSIILDQMKGEKEYTVEENITVPEGATTGPYHLQIRYFDAAGNEGEGYVSTVEISSESRSPTITITNFGEEEELSPTENEDGTKVLYLSGSIESKTAAGLDEVHIIVEHHEETSIAHGRILHEDYLYDNEWELSGASGFNLDDISPVIDLSNAEAGHYELWIKAQDLEGNIKIVTREIHID